MSRASYIDPIYPTVSVALNGIPIGGSVIVSNVPGSCTSGLVEYVFDQDFPAGFTGYVVGGVNTFTISTTNLTQVGFGTIQVSWVVAYDVNLVSGDGQIGAVTGPLDLPLRVRLQSGAQNPQYAGQPVVFKITQTAGAGATIAGDEYAASQTYTATADGQGFADAVLVLGSSAGSYTVEASSPSSANNKTVTFTATAQKPDKVLISKNQPDVASAGVTFAVSLLQEPSFYAVGVDAQGAKIGRVKCDWTAAGKGKGVGAGTLAPSASPASAVTFTPTDLGKLVLAANPGVSGLGTAKANLLVGGIYVQVGPTFDPTTDELPKFVPGSDLSGNSLPVPDPANGSKPIQTVTLHLLTDPVLKGKPTDTVTYQLSNVSNYPGVAMNWPATNPASGKDLDFAGGQQSTPTITLDASGDTKTPLYVYDYGAYGELTATVVTSKKKFTINLTLPDTTINHNKMPDQGWRAENVPIPNSQLDPAADDDPNPPMLLSLPDVSTGAGDNLTNFEEYRGFVFFGSHRRTNPFHKDYFIEGSAFGDDIGYAYPALPASTYRVAYGDYDHVDFSRLQLVNPNWQGLPGATNHHVEKIVVVRDGGSSPMDGGGVTDCGPMLPLGVPRVPNLCSRIFVFSQNISAAVGDDPVKALSLRRAVVAHEAGHSVNLFHNTKDGCMMYGGALQTTGTIPTQFCSAIDSTTLNCDTCDPPKLIPVSNFNETSTMRIRP